MAELTVPGGGRLPPHRDATEAYLLVQQGKGTVTIDGIAYAVEPGSLIYVPAGVKVSYVNGAQRLVALQIYAGPEPASRYADWNRWVAPPAIEPTW